MGKDTPEIRAETQPEHAGPTPAEDTPAPQAKEATQPQAQPEEQPKPKKKDDRLAARLAFYFVNFFGLHLVGNSTLSLGITYNILPLPWVQKGIVGLAKIWKPVANVIDHVKTPFRSVFEATKNKLGFAKVEEVISAAEKELVRKRNVAHSARSFVETMSMCIAGCIVLFPVKGLENYREPILNFFDKLFHPFRKRTPEEEKAVREARPHEENETWWNLIKTRFISLIPIFAIDAGIQAINNNAYEKPKDKSRPYDITINGGNVDTFLWKTGAAVYDNKNNALNRFLNKILPKDWRRTVINFFSFKDIDLTSIQAQTRTMVLKTTGATDLMQTNEDISRLQHLIAENPEKELEIQGWKKEIELLNEKFKADHFEVVDPVRKKYIPKTELGKQMERAVAAEQTRLFAKEIYLTAIYTGFLFVLGKTKLLPWMMEKVGLKKKESHDIEHGLEVNTGLPPVGDGLAGKKFAAAKEKSAGYSNSIKPRDKMEKPDALHAVKVATTDAGQPLPSF